MFNRIPLRCTSWVMCHGNAQASLICDLLKPLFPCVSSHAVRATGISEDQQLLRFVVDDPTNSLPPRADRVGCEGGGIVRRSDDDSAIATSHIVDAVGNRHTLGIAWEVVHVDIDWRPAPRATLVLERTNEFSLLRVYADDRLIALLEGVGEPIDPSKLPIANRRSFS